MQLHTHPYNMHTQAFKRTTDLIITPQVKFETNQHRNLKEIACMGACEKKLCLPKDA